MYQNILPRASLVVMVPANLCTAPTPAAPTAASDTLNVCASVNHKGHLQLKIEQPCWALLAPFLGIGGVDHDLAAQPAQPPWCVATGGGTQQRRATPNVDAAGPAMVPYWDAQPIWL